MDNRLEYFSLDSRWLRESESLRLDASHYNPTVVHAMESLRKAGLPLLRLGDLVERVFIPHRFARTYVSKEHGVPFLQGSHIVHFQPADLKYISLAVHKQMDKLLIYKNWILVTRSGSVGRVAITSDTWDGWAASEHIFRIIPARNNELCPPGYLYAYLTSPIGQAQLASHIYGAVVDELTEEQVRSILVPVPETKAQIKAVQLINDLALKSIELKDQAIRLAEEAVAAIDGILPVAERIVKVGEPKPTSRKSA